jgi:hypothetical protein
MIHEKKAEAKKLVTLQVAEICQYCWRKGEGVDHREEGRVHCECFFGLKKLPNFQNGAVSNS